MKSAGIKKRIRGLVTFVVVIAVLFGAYQVWAYFNHPTTTTPSSPVPITASGAMSASGTIESRNVNIAAELGGRILDVKADEGQKVTAGEVLVTLDDSALQAQYAQAKAALDVAQANLDLVSAPATPEQIRQAQASLLAATAAYSRTVAATRPTDIAAAQANLSAAVQSYNKVKAGPLKEDYAAAEAAYQNAQAAVQLAQHNYDQAYRLNPAAIGASPMSLALQQATNNFEAAKSAYDKLTMMPDNAQISAAYQAVSNAQAALERTQNPARDFDVVQAQAQIDMAQAQLDALKAGPRPQQIAVARMQVAQAQSALKAIEINIAKMTIKSPADGVILTRNNEPGELASPGAAVLVVGKLTELELTVYIPESQFALITPGRSATVSVDAYPGRVFNATVLRVADQAQFTPRNVSTVEGRKDTVYGVRLSIDNPDLALKAGMPADVTFQTK
ncbi:MAG TPA: efflux RND transporter periplasmic adaptor subunit [Anaerolineae bacterium]